MSKVISFSISDRYLDKLRTLYPALTDNLAAKQFLTDRLDSRLGNSLDDSLDGRLDGKLKTIIETSLDGRLDERLDATVGKLITSLSERMARLEARLDDSLDGRLDDMELLLRMQREASIATSPLPPSPSLPPDEPDQPAIASIDGTVEAVYTVETADTVEPDSINEPVKEAIATVRGDTDSSIETVTSAYQPSSDSKPWYTIDELLDCHYSGWPKTKERLRKKALTEGWPRRMRRGSKGNPYEYQAVLPE